MAATVPNPPFLLLYPLFIVQCSMIAWAAHSRNSTGMLEGDIQNSPALSNQLDNLSTRQQSFNIKDPYNSWTGDDHFPLYNPESNGVDKLVITINHKINSNNNDTNFTDGTGTIPPPPDQRFKVLAICTFLRMDEF